MEYPKWLYHAEQAPEGRLFRKPEETAQLGPGWVDSPAKFAAPAPEASKSEAAQAIAPPPAVTRPLAAEPKGAKKGKDAPAAL